MFDTHAHLISDSDVAYPRAPAAASKDKEPEASLTPEDLLSCMESTGVSRALLVQRGSLYGFDNRYVCDSAARYPQRLAAVCAIDAAAADPAAAVRYWVRERGAVGIRLMELTRGSDLSWLGASGSYPVWREAEAQSIPVCVHFFPWNRLAGLAALRQVLAAIPTVRVVIDHFSNMNVQAGPPDFGLDDPLRTLGEFSGVTIKFTTIPLGRLDAAGMDSAAILERVIAHFGEQRLMWGSDVGQSAGDYGHMVQLARHACRTLSAQQQDWVLSRTGLTTYWPAAPTPSHSN